MTAPRRPRLNLNPDLARTDAVDWRSRGVDATARIRMAGCLDSVLRSMDRRWIYVVVRDSKPIYQSTALQRRLIVGPDDYSWIPDEVLDLERGVVELPGSATPILVRRCGQISVAWLGELDTALPALDQPLVPPLQSGDLDEFAVALASATQSTNWHLLSFGRDGKLDPVSPGAMRRFGFEQSATSWTWVPESWAEGSHDIVDLVQLPDGRTRLAVGELVQHDLGTLAVFKLCQLTQEANPLRSSSSPTTGDVDPTNS